MTDKWDTSYMQYVDEGDLELPLLRKIGVFKFWGGTYSGAASQMKLTGMADFAGVTEIGSVDIKYWGKMTDFSGLKMRCRHFRPTSGMSRATVIIRPGSK